MDDGFFGPLVLAIAFPVALLTIWFVVSEGDDGHKEDIAQGPPCSDSEEKVRVGYVYNRGDHSWEPIWDCREKTNQTA